MSSDKPLSGNSDKQKLGSAWAWLIWGLAAAYFFADYVARVSLGVMSRDIQQAFEITAVGLGALSSFFYYPYVAMQLPVGLLVDRYSIRLILSFMSVVTAVGCLTFGLATSLWLACIGRALIGFSAAFAFVSALRLAAMWFPPSRLGLLAGLTQALGMLGAACGEAPIAYLSASVGWRNTQLIMSLGFIVLSLLMFAFIRETTAIKKRAPTTPSKPSESAMGSVLSLLKNKQIQLNALYAGLLFAPTAVIAEMWGPAFLQYGRGLSEHSAAFADGLIFIGWAIGGPLAGFISDKLGRRKPVMIVTAVLSLILMSIILYAPSLSLSQVYLLFFSFGLCNTGVVVAYAVCTEAVSKQMIGTSIALTNMYSVIVGALLQPLIGFLMNWHTGHAVRDIASLTAGNFQAVFILLPLSLVFCVLCACLLQETYCRALGNDLDH